MSTESNINESSQALTFEETEEVLTPVPDTSHVSDERVLCVLKGTFKDFDYKYILRILTEVGAKVSRVHIKNPSDRRYTRRPTYGFVTFETKEDLQNFLKNNCTLGDPSKSSNNVPSYIFNHDGSFLIFKYYISRGKTDKSTQDVQAVKKIFINGLPGTNTQELLSAFFKDNKIETKKVTINVNPENNTGSATVILKDENQGKELIGKSYETKGIEFNGHTLKIRKFNSVTPPKRMYKKDFPEIPRRAILKRETKPFEPFKRPTTQEMMPQPDDFLLKTEDTYSATRSLEEIVPQNSGTFVATKSLDEFPVLMKQEHNIL